MENQSSKVLEITPEEEEAIMWYQGDSTLINELMGNFISGKAKDAYRVDKSSEPYYNYDNVESMMNYIEKIYSAMVKHSLASPASSMRLYRGSNKGLNRGNENGFISTTVNRNEALLFAVHNSKYYDRDATVFFSRMVIAKNAPYYIMPSTGNEKEVLLSPFLECKETGFQNGQYNGHEICIQDVELVPTPLKEFPNMDREATKRAILENASRIGELTNEYMKLSIQYENAINPNPNLREQMKEKLQTIGAWKKEFRNLMEARCSDIEKNIRLELENERENQELKAVEQRKIEQAKSNGIMMEQKEVALKIKRRIKDTQARILQYADGPMQLCNDARQFGIEYESHSKNLRNAVLSWKYESGVADSQTFSRISGIMQEASSKSDIIRSELLKTEENDIKRTIAENVMKIRLNAEKNLLQTRINNSKNQKSGLIGIMLGKDKKNKEYEAQLFNKCQTIESIRDAVERNGFSKDEKYSLHDVLSEIEVAKNIGGLTPKEQESLKNYQAFIKKNYGINEAIVNSKTKNKLEKTQDDRIRDLLVDAQSKTDKDPFNQNMQTDSEKYCFSIGRYLSRLDREHNRTQTRDVDNRRE